MTDGDDQGNAQTLPPSVGEELRHLQDHAPLPLVLDDIMDYAVFMVTLDGRIASWNSGAQRLKGYTEAEAIGRPFAMLFTAEDRARNQPDKEMRVALEHGVYQGEGERRRKDGSTFEAEVTLRTIRDDAGEPRGYIKITRDITERKRLQDLSQARLEFERQLVGIVSHDLRNPLNAMLLGASMLLARPDTDSGAARILHRIISSGERAGRLIRDLLDFTQVRLGGGLILRTKEVDLAELTALVVEEIRLAHPDRTIVVNGASTLSGSFDADRIAQLLTNVVSNAVKHGAADRDVTVTVRPEGDQVAIEVHNWGTPISPEIIPKLFEPLRRGNHARSIPGSIGLGLFIASSVAKAHGGFVDVRSTAKEGTTFTARLDRATRATGASASSPPSAAP